MVMLQNFKSTEKEKDKYLKKKKAHYIDYAKIPTINSKTFQELPFK